MDQKQLESRPETTPKTTPKTTQQDEPKPTKFAWFKTLFISAFVSILVSGASFYIYDIYYAPKFLTVDFKGYVEQQRKLFLAKKIDETDLKKNLKIFQEKIKAVPENTIVLIKEAVVSDEETIEN